MKTKLVIGCGKMPREGYLNTDMTGLPGVDRILDLNDESFDLPSDHFEEIIAENVLEHVEDLARTMSELHRILKRGGRLVIRVPHFTYSGAFTDPTHRCFFTFDTFGYFVRGQGEYDFYFPFHFTQMHRKLTFGKRYALWNYVIEPLANWFPSVYENSPLRMFPAEELRVTLVK